MWIIINFIQALLILIWTIIAASTGFIIYIITWSKKAPMIVSHFWGPLLLWTSGVRLRVTGKENIDKNNYYIYVSNHESLMDIPAIFTALPVNVFFVAKKELQKVPFLGWFMIMVGMIFIDRGNKEKAYESMRKAGQLIKNGRNVISFPEGTRNTDGKIKMFKRGSFIMAKAGNVSIVPIAIKGAREVLPSEKNKLRPGLIKLKIGKPISGDQFSKDEVDLFANYVRDQVIEMRNSL